MFQKIVINYAKLEYALNIFMKKKVDRNFYVHLNRKVLTWKIGLTNKHSVVNGENYAVKVEM